MPVIDADAWYEELMNAHHGLSDRQSVLLNCALVLLLADRVANPDELSQCLTEARVAALDDGKGVS